MRFFLKNLFISLTAVILIRVFTIKYPQPSMYQYAALLLALLIFYNLILPFLFRLNTLYIRTKRRIFPSIAILSGNVKSPVGEYKCKRSWMFITPGMWLYHLNRMLRKGIWRKLNLNIAFIHLKDIHEKYSMIINPFGDNFPEENTRLLTSFYKISEYVDGDGFFICTGGVFYNHQNTMSSEEAEQVIIKTRDGVQRLTDTLLYKELGILTTGDGSPNEKHKVEVYQKNEDQQYLGNVLDNISSVKRFRATSKESSNFIPLVREKDGECFPVVAIPFGGGFFVHFGVLLESIDSDEFTVIANVIDKIIYKRFKIH